MLRLEERGKEEMDGSERWLERSREVELSNSDSPTQTALLPSDNTPFSDRPGSQKKMRGFRSHYSVST